MNTALIIVDMQQAFCYPEGSFQRRGYSISNVKQVMQQCMLLRDLAGKKGWPVIFTRLIFDANYDNAGLLVENNPQIKELRAYAADTADCLIIDELAPKPGDLIIGKQRYDSFIGTDLERKLQDRHIQQLIVCGLVTNVCVESTVRSACDRNFRVIVAEDATASYSQPLYEASLETMRRHFAKSCSVNDLLKQYLQA